MNERGRRRRARRKCRCALAWMVVIAVEVAIAAAPAALAGTLLIPLAYAERGYFAIGGEWLGIAFLFCASYALLHRKVCDLIFGEEEDR